MKFRNLASTFNINFIFFLLLIIISISFESCRNCSGVEPFMTQEEKEWLTTNTQQGDIYYFESNTGERRPFVVVRKEIKKMEARAGKNLEVCPEDNSFWGEYILSTPMDSKYTYVRTLEIKTTKNTGGFNKSLSWSGFTGPNGFDTHIRTLQTLNVKGKEFKDVMLFESDTTHNYGFPATHRMYFNKQYGLLKFENTGHETWERLP